MLKIKNWERFQSYKDRNPNWVKIHKSFLDDFQFHKMSFEAKAILPMLWLLASEHTDPTSGIIEMPLDEIAFRLRIDEKILFQAVKEVIFSGFILEINDKEPDLFCNSELANKNNVSTESYETVLNLEKSVLQRKRKEEEESKEEKEKEGYSPTPHCQELLKISKNEIEEAKSEYNAIAEKHGLPQCQVLSESRKQKLKQRLKEAGGIEGWKSAMSKIEESNFLLGDNNRGWKISIDFLLQQSSFIGLMEGKYSNNPVKPKNKTYNQSRADRYIQAGREALEEIERMEKEDGDPIINSLI